MTEVVPGIDLVSGLFCAELVIRVRMVEHLALHGGGEVEVGIVVDDEVEPGLERDLELPEQLDLLQVVP